MTTQIEQLQLAVRHEVRRVYECGARIEVDQNEKGGSVWHTLLQIVNDT